MKYLVGVKMGRPDQLHTSEGVVLFEIHRHVSQKPSCEVSDKTAAALEFLFQNFPKDYEWKEAEKPEPQPKFDPLAEAARVMNVVPAPVLSLLLDGRPWPAHWTVATMDAVAHASASASVPEKAPALAQDAPPAADAAQSSPGVQTEAAGPSQPSDLPWSQVRSAKLAQYGADTVEGVALRVSDNRGVASVEKINAALGAAQKPALSADEYESLKVKLKS